MRIFEKIISQNHIFFFEEKWLILAGKMGDVSVWSLTSRTEYHICRSYAPHERGTLPQLAADCGCRQNLSHSYPRTWYSRVRSCEQSGFSALKYNNKEAMWNPLEYDLAYGVICWPIFLRNGHPELDLVYCQDSLVWFWMQTKRKESFLKNIKWCICANVCNPGRSDVLSSLSCWLLCAVAVFLTSLKSEAECWL